MTASPRARRHAAAGAGRARCCCAPASSSAPTGSSRRSGARMPPRRRRTRSRRTSRASAATSARSPTGCGPSRAATGSSSRTASWTRSASRAATEHARTLPAAERGRRALRAALALWRGPVLADLGYETFAQTERAAPGGAARPGDSRSASRPSSRWASTRRSPTSSSALVAEHPLRERLRGQQMLALYRLGRHAEALDAYRDLRDAARPELGLEPGPELRELEQAILTHDVARARGRGARARRRRPSAARTTCAGSATLLDDRRAAAHARSAPAASARRGSRSSSRAPTAARFVSLALGRRRRAGRARDLRRAADHARARGGRRGRARTARSPASARRSCSTTSSTCRRRGAGDRPAARSRAGADRGRHEPPAARRCWPSSAIPVAPLAEAAAVRLFESRARAATGVRARPTTTGPRSPTSAARLGGLPLAIELAAGAARGARPARPRRSARRRAGPARPGPERRARSPAHPARDAGLELRRCSSEPEREAFAALGAFAGGCDLEAAEIVTRRAAARARGARRQEPRDRRRRAPAPARAGPPVRRRAPRRAADATAPRRALPRARRAHPPRPVDARPSDARASRQVHRERDNFRAALDWARSARDRPPCSWPARWTTTGSVTHAEEEGRGWSSGRSRSPATRRPRPPTSPGRSSAARELRHHALRRARVEHATAALELFRGSATTRGIAARAGAAGQPRTS